MSALWIFFHNLALSDNVAENFFKAVNAESFLEDSYRFDVIGIIFGPPQDLVLGLILVNLELVKTKVIHSDQQQQTMWNVSLV